MTKQYSGGCHCGRLRFDARLDLSAGTYRCNCTYCRKMRVWIARAAENDFVYTVGGDSVATYRVREDGFATFHFCDHCGVRIGTAVSHPQYGEFFNVSIGALEGVDEEEL
ncbi:MAG: GFA family protein, partial [Pseudomonadota bacterium]